MVMYPNVYGMGLFSDGGIFSTKPYICGSSYFRNDGFQKGSWWNVLDGFIGDLLKIIEIFLVKTQDYL